MWNQRALQSQQDQLSVRNLFSHVLERRHQLLDARLAIVHAELFIARPSCMSLGTCMNTPYERGQCHASSTAAAGSASAFVFAFALASPHVQ